MQREFECAGLEQVALKMTASLDLEEVLTTVTQGLVEQINADFARIWLLGPGDLCTECYKLPDCKDHECCLHLKASAGKYTHINGEYRRIPMGAFVVGQIAENKAPLVTSDLMNEESFANKNWILANGFSSYAGCPLVFRDELMGVVAMFSRDIMPVLNNGFYS